MNPRQAAWRALLLACLLAQLAACRPEPPAPELLEQQRAVLEQSRQLGQEMQQQLDSRMQAAEAAEK